MSTPVPSGYLRLTERTSDFKNIDPSTVDQHFAEVTKMNKVSLLVSTGILLIIVGCSADSQKTASKNAPAVVQASAAPATLSLTIQPTAAQLPIPSVGHPNQQSWRSENVGAPPGNVVTLKATSTDGKFDLVILHEGTHCFLSFVRHAHWNAVHNQPAKGKLMYLRAKFDDGQEKRIEWDELGFATENLYSVLWSYPAKADAPIGPAPSGSASDSVGGDQLLIQEMVKHNTMLLEVEPGVTAQFDMAGLAHEMEKVCTLKTQAVLEARQTSE